MSVGSFQGQTLLDLETTDFPSGLQTCTAHLYIGDSRLHFSSRLDDILATIGLVDSDLHWVGQLSVGNYLDLYLDNSAVLKIPQIRSKL